MHALLKNALAVAGVAIAAQAAADVTFYKHEDFKGNSFNAVEDIANLKRHGFNDRASSVVVERDWWQVCEDADFGGRCVVLRPGRYSSLADMGLNDRVSSLRLMNFDPRQRGNMGDQGNPYLPGNDGRSTDNRYMPNRSWPVAPYDYQRRHAERTYEVKVTSVRAVVGPPERRCWVESEQVVQDRNRNNVPGAIVGALIGGVLGHQIGGGSGQDLATAGGAVAGAAVGANVNRNDDRYRTAMRDVEHCADQPRYARPEFWDVTYNFRGIEHRIQVTAPPGPTITVNEQGEPRV